MAKIRFKECVTCKPPKRHPGCQDTCPDYLKNKADLDKEKAIVHDAMNKQRAVSDYQSGAYHRMKHNRGKNTHAK